MKYKKELEKRKKEFIKENGAICQKCGRKKNLSIDHIVPIETLRLMGFNKEEMFDEENFEVLCEGCNNFKGKRLDFSNPKTKELLLKYLDKI